MLATGAVGSQRPSPTPRLSDGVVSHLRTANRRTSWNCRSPSSSPSTASTKEVAELKARPGRELQVHGSGELIGSLLAANLVDTLNILTFPVLLGTGKRLFPENSHPAAFTLAETRVTTKGVLIATYRKDGPPTYGDFGSDQ
ncbi:dihydrofolate reductase family protein [Nocardia tengchongensis]|uniref:dihydrofolate reductase family protein n=1 Tax=Nocardia tengchongensis TaxID=2055889 RepID=UPI003673665B